MVYHAYISQFKNLKDIIKLVSACFHTNRRKRAPRHWLLSVQICPTVSQRLWHCGNVFVRRSHFKFKTEPTQSSTPVVRSSRLLFPWSALSTAQLSSSNRMQPIANGKCDVESAAVQKQPGSTKTKEYYEATILIFCHAYMILLMHHGQGKPYSMFLHNSNLDPALISHINLLTLLGCVCLWINKSVAIKKALHHVLVGILALISIIMGVFLFVMRFPTSLPDFASIEATYCLNSHSAGTWYSFILRNYWLWEILIVLVELLSILAEGTVIVAAFAWWRLSREMMVPSKSSA